MVPLANSLLLARAMEGGQARIDVSDRDEGGFQAWRSIVGADGKKMRTAGKGPTAYIRDEGEAATNSDH